MDAHILTVDDEPVNQRLVSKVLTASGYQVTTADSAKEAFELVERIHFDLIILDVLMPEIDGYEACRRLRENPLTAQTPIILLTALDSLDSKMKGFEAGADDYLPKPCEPEELVARVRVWLRRSASIKEEKVSDRLGKVIAVFSLRGGVGVTSIAANLSVGLAQLWGNQTALIDMVFNAGQAALMLNLPLRNTWSDIANVPAKEIDRDMVNMLLRIHSSGTNVLPAPRKIQDGELIDAEKVQHVIDIIQQEYEYILLDLPHNFSDTTLTGLDIADDILVVFTPELASVRATSMALDIFDSLDYPRDIIHLVLNWTFARNGLARDDIQATLNRKIELVLPNAPDQFIKAINFGAPPVYSEPNTPLAALFEDMSFALSKEEHRKKRPEEPTAAWIRLAKRMQQRKKK
jgi:pilus assembly protein CpaE